jgi:hypothetical protein
VDGCAASNQRREKRMLGLAPGENGCHVNVMAGAGLFAGEPLHYPLETADVARRDDVENHHLQASTAVVPSGSTPA